MVQNNRRFAKSNVKKERKNQVMKKERFFFVAKHNLAKTPHCDRISRYDPFSADDLFRKTITL
jgi:hypothetical protein